MANEKIQTARDAEAAAKELLDQVNKDGKVTAEEQQQLKDAQAEVQKAKDDTQQVIDNLPKREQSSLQKNLDKVKGIEVPKVTKDDNSNNNNNNQNQGGNNPSQGGNNPSQGGDNPSQGGGDNPSQGGGDNPTIDPKNPNEGSDDVQPKIDAAKTAAEAAATAKAAAEKDGVVSAEEAKNVNDLIAKAETAKEAAQQAVDGLPTGEYK
ncbi:GA-like domain-containing protein, partial [Gallibacterium anatis]